MNKPTYSIADDWDQRLRIEGDLVTNGFLVGPREIWSKRPAHMRHMLTIAGTEGIANEWKYWNGQRLCDRLTMLIRDDGVRVAFARPAGLGWRGRPMLHVYDRTGRRQKFNAQAYRALEYIADEMRLQGVHSALIAYRNGEPVGALMPIV